MRLRTAVGLGVGTVLAYRHLLRPWHERWGATDEEVASSLPGDDLVAEPASQTTRAITIEAPVEAVWAWLIQVGAERGGFYSYDWLEDAFGLGIHSAMGLVPEWQQRTVGDVVYGDSKRRGGWYVMDVQPNRALVLQTGDLKHGRPASRSHGAFMEFSWAFVLRDNGDGTTRLLVRERVWLLNPMWRTVMSPVGLVSFVMTQKMMRGIKARAETLGPTHVSEAAEAG